MYRRAALIVFVNLNSGSEELVVICSEKVE